MTHGLKLPILSKSVVTSYGEKTQNVEVITFIEKIFLEK